MAARRRDANEPAEKYCRGGAGAREKSDRNVKHLAQGGKRSTVERKCWCKKKTRYKRKPLA